MHLVNVYQQGSVAKIIKALSIHSDSRFRHCVVSLDYPERRLPREDELPNLAIGARYRINKISRHVSSMVQARNTVIHAHMGWATAIAPALASRIGVPSVITFHSELAHYARPVQRLIRLGASYYSRNGVKLTYTGVSRAVSDQWAAYLEYPVLANHNPLLLPVGNPRENKKQGERVELNFVSVARVTKTKNLIFALRVIRAIRDLGIRCTYTIVGDGPARPDLEKKIDILGLSDEVQLVGYRADVIPYLDQADIFLLPSEEEGFCMAALEAMARGCVVITHSGLPAVMEFVVNDLNGLIIPNLDVAAWVLRIREICEYPERLRVMSEKAVSSASKYTGDVMANAYHATYLKVLG